MCESCRKRGRPPTARRLDFLCKGAVTRMRAHARPSSGALQRTADRSLTARWFRRAQHWRMIPADFAETGPSTAEGRSRLPFVHGHPLRSRSKPIRAATLLRGQPLGGEHPDEIGSRGITIGENDDGNSRCRGSESARRSSRVRPLSRRAISSNRSCECTLRLVPFWKYCRRRPLVFSSKPRCQELGGSAPTATAQLLPRPPYQ